MPKCQNEYCEVELQEHCDYEETKSGYDEDKGSVVDIYEVRICQECGFKNEHWVADAPNKGAW